MDETGAYEALKPRIAHLDPQRVENVLSAGTPDVWYTHGAIEMKYRPDWPVRPNTPVRVQTLIDRPEQVAWLTRRWYAGGPAWLMLRVVDQYILFSGPHSRWVRAGLTRHDMFDVAVWFTDQRGQGDWDMLSNWLTWKVEALPPLAAQRLRELQGRVITKSID